MKLFKHLIFFSLFWVLFFQEVFSEDQQKTSKYAPSLTLMLPMRDGAALPTDIYLPKDFDLEKKYPLVLLRNPSGRQAAPWMKYADLTHHGFIVAFQDTRSALDPEGKTMPFLADGWGDLQDGYDTVEALARYEFCNGKIGTAGFSATGITQHMLAPTAPPALKAQYIGVAASNLYHDAIYLGGCLQKNQVEGWLGTYAKDPSMNKIVLNESNYNSFWKKFNALDNVEKVNVPGLLYGGWFDTFLQGTLEAFVARQESGAEGAKGLQKLIIGPWTHSWPASMKLGDFEVPEKGRHSPWDMTPLAWFNFYLKDIPTGINSVPSVTYYVMGPFDGSPSKGNVWKYSNKWPVQATLTPYYLEDSGALQKNLALKYREVTYPIDLNEPIPTLGGRNLFLEAGPKDQKTIESRKDILLFTTSPLDEDLEVTGKILAKIYYKPIENDADLIVRLCDVYPDGSSILLADGAYRIKADSSQEKQVLHMAEIDLWSTSFVFAKGHRIRISVSGSNYPRFEKPMHFNKNSGESHRTEVTLLIGKEAPSHILLPVVH